MSAVMKHFPTGVTTARTPDLTKSADPPEGRPFPCPLAGTWQQLKFGGGHMDSSLSHVSQIKITSYCKKKWCFSALKLVNP